VSISLLDYDSERFGPFLGISDEGSAAEAIAEAAISSPKALALGAPDPLVVGIGHDAERLGSLGEVPVGPKEYERIRAGSNGRVLLTTNVGSHVARWHYRQPLCLEVSDAQASTPAAAWAQEHGTGTVERDPQPWLRLRLDPAMSREAALVTVRAAAAEASVALAVRAEDGADAAHKAMALAAEGGAKAVVIDGEALAPSEARPTSPGLLNYFPPSQARSLLEDAHRHGVAIEPAFKVDTDSVANQVWAGLFAARGMGLHLGKYGLFPLTLQEAQCVIEQVQGWLSDWSAAPAIYLDVPTVDGQHVYELSDAPLAARRWLEVAAGAGAPVVLIDTVEKFRGLRLIKGDDSDGRGILAWSDIDELQCLAAELDVKILWAGGIALDQLYELGRMRPFGVYVTSAVSNTLPAQLDEKDIGLHGIKEPNRNRILQAKLLLEIGFFAENDPGLEVDAVRQGDVTAVARLAEGLKTRWQKRFADRA
jgi:hypothetical protein